MTRKKTTTLVIHPIDKTTDFLAELYRERDDAIVVRGDVGRERLKEIIADLDPQSVYMLGHGLADGLLGHYKMMIDENFVPLLRGRDLFGVWCNADVFFRKHELPGLFTGMIVSEPAEAQLFNLDDRPEPIEESNARLAKAIAAGLKARDEGRIPPEEVADLIRDSYLDRHSPTFTMPVEGSVMHFNSQRIYYTPRSGQKVNVELENECMVS